MNGEKQMRLISVRKGFQSDHSSTSYEFLAIDKKLSIEQKKSVSKLSSRACPTDRQVSFVYNGDWSDLPGGWKPLMEKYYDVMYSESYDWWTLAFAFQANKETIGKLKEYDFCGDEDLGVRILSKNNRVVIAFFCRIHPDPNFFGDYNDYEYGYGYYEEERDHEDKFLKLLKKNRELLKRGDYRLLFGIWEQYGDGYTDSPPEPEKIENLPKATKNLLDMLDNI